MTTELPIDVLTGVPTPRRSRWQPLRAGILNLFKYDEQIFTFHRGRLLLRGNNGSGKSMALEVLLPYLLDADLTPSRLSTFGGRDRNMYLWLIGYDASGERTSERAYVWVEFGRRLLTGDSEYFTAGAMLEGSRGGEVKAHYFTTAARVGIDVHLGGPGTEPLNRNGLTTLLDQHNAQGRTGKVHADAKSHRRAVNDTLYRLETKRFDALRSTLLQLRRPKLSDKLDEKGLNQILCDALPPVAESVVADLAEGFERLDRHAAALQELRGIIEELLRLRDVYGRYARTAAAARADAVSAAESAIDAVRGKISAAQLAQQKAGDALEVLERRRGQIAHQTSRISGEIRGLEKQEAYQRGQDLSPLRELVAGLLTIQRGATERARRSQETAEKDSEAADRRIQQATECRDRSQLLRDRAAMLAIAAHTEPTDTAATAALTQIGSSDVEDPATLRLVVDRARRQLGRHADDLTSWAKTTTSLSQVAAVQQLAATALATARTESERAEQGVNDQEDKVNQQLVTDHEVRLAWVDDLTTWADRSTELVFGQAAPLPWQPDTALQAAPRWAREASAARTRTLLAEVAALRQAAHAREVIASTTRGFADLVAEVVQLLGVANQAEQEYQTTLSAYRSAVVAWTVDLVELPSALPVPSWDALAVTDIAAVAARWSQEAATARSRDLAQLRAGFHQEREQLTTRIGALTGRESRLAAGGLPELPVPSTRQTPRHERAGAPFFMLVDFIDGVPPEDQRGIEAAVFAAGIADAWVSPGGRLIRAEDERLLLDTQLEAGEQPRSRNLTQVLTPAADCIEVGVTPEDVLRILHRIEYAPSTVDTAIDAPLAVGRDGTWRAGPLTGAHTVTLVTLIGATNREASRLAELVSVRAELSTLRNEDHALALKLEQTEQSERRVSREQASLPQTTAIGAARDHARDTLTQARAALTSMESRSATLTPPAPIPDVDDQPVSTRLQALTAQAVTVARAGLTDPRDLAAQADLESTDNEARLIAAGWDGSARAAGLAADSRADAVETVRRQVDAMPSPDAVHAAISALDIAERELVAARGRHAERAKEEEQARERAEIANAGLYSALLGAGLTAGTDPDTLARAVRDYQHAFTEWSHAITESITAQGEAALALRRSLNSAELAQGDAETAADAVGKHLEKATELEALSRDYGDDYTRIVEKIASLSLERTALAGESSALDIQERPLVETRATAAAQLATLDSTRHEAEEARTQAGAAFLAAHRLGLLVAAGLPDSPISLDSAGERVSDTSALGVRALLAWARTVREAVGDRVQRTPAAVEAAANRVNETRYSLEPTLAGRITLRDEQRDGLLVLHATRGVEALPLLDMLTALGETLTRDEGLLAAHEADLFRKFLADSTRREVTSRVRDARTAIKDMADLMAKHPTGSEIYVRLLWTPDERNAPGMQDIIKLMGKDAPLDSERERLQSFFRNRVELVRANGNVDYKAQMGQLLDYRQWWRFSVEYRRGRDGSWAPLTSKAHGGLSGGEKAVCLHLPLFAAAATYCDSAGVRAHEPDGTTAAGAPRLILLDEIFAGVDEDNRGELFDIVRDLDMDLVATSESEQGFYPQLDGLSVYQLISSDTAVLAARSIWDGRTVHRMLDEDLLGLSEPDLFTP